jgi:tetratricopeptide (TPR) repeat protein
MALTRGCNLSMVMPRTEKEDLSSTLLSIGADGIGALHSALAGTSVKEARTSVGSDRDKILSMVKENPGYAAFNNQVNNHLRRWANETIRESIENRGRYATTLPLGDAMFFNRVYSILKDNGEFAAALEVADRALNVLGAESEYEGEAEKEARAMCHFNVRCILFEHGDYDGAYEKQLSALMILEAVHHRDYRAIASSCSTVGHILCKQGVFKEACKKHVQALTMRKSGLLRERCPAKEESEDESVWKIPSEAEVDDHNESESYEEEPNWNVSPRKRTTMAVRGV